jgi:2'-5' RNA ligase
VTKYPVHYLWMVPEAQAHRRLAALIESLSAPLGAPVFEPHVTLLGTLEGPADALVEHTGRLAAALPEFEVRPAGIEHLRQFYRCLFLRLEMTQALARARALAQQVFRIADSDPDYLPHLSVLYGEYPVATKRRLQETVTPQNLAPFRVDRLQLVAGAARPEAWRRVATMSLQGAAR